MSAQTISIPANRAARRRQARESRLAHRAFARLAAYYGVEFGVFAQAYLDAGEQGAKDLRTLAYRAHHAGRLSTDDARRCGCVFRGR